MDRSGRPETMGGKKDKAVNFYLTPQSSEIIRRYI
jgi:hypothetical protein